MWTCPNCNRNFKNTNQSHMCVDIDVGELFIGKPDDLVLAYDKLTSVLEKWEPNTVGASVNTVVFTSEKAWLIVRPMKKVLDVKFYSDEIIESDLIHRTSMMGKKYAHHIRISHEDDLTPEFYELLRVGHKFSLR